jgi:hypothetical protein
MAININTVYKEVLNIIKNDNIEKASALGKDSVQVKNSPRPYLTPAEFNIFAIRAQEDIFENTVHDYKQAWLAGDKRNAELIKEKLKPFIIEGSDVNKDNGDVGNSPYWIINIYDMVNSVYYEEVDIDYFNKVKTYSTTASGSKVYFPVSNPKHHIYYRKDTNTVVFHPTPTANPDADIITAPSTNPHWASTYTAGVIEYDSSSSENFLLHDSEHGTVVNKICELAGISYRDKALADLSLRNESTNIEDKIR